MARTGSMLGVIASAAMLAACSGSDDAAPETTVEVPTTVAATVPDPTTTIAPSTQAPTTTIDPATALAEEVEADLLEALALGRMAQMNPPDLAAEKAALDRRIGVLRTNLKRQLAEYRERNYALRTNTSTPPSVTVEVPAMTVLNSDDVAEVQVCEIDSWVLVEVGAGPGGTDAVVDPDVLAYRTTFFLRLVDGTWNLEGGNEIARWEGATSCPVD